jgi:hypothetical protein
VQEMEIDGTGVVSSQSMAAQFFLLGFQIVNEGLKNVEQFSKQTICYMTYFRSG